MSYLPWAERGLNHNPVQLYERRAREFTPDPVVEVERRQVLAKRAAQEAERKARRAAGDPALVGRHLDPATVQVKPLPAPDPFKGKTFIRLMQYEHRNAKSRKRQPKGGT